MPNNPTYPALEAALALFLPTPQDIHPLDGDSRSGKQRVRDVVAEIVAAQTREYKELEM